MCVCREIFYRWEYQPKDYGQQIVMLVRWEGLGDADRTWESVIKILPAMLKRDFRRIRLYAAKRSYPAIWHFFGSCDSTSVTRDA